MVDLEQFIDAFVIDLEPGKIEIVNAGQKTDGRFDRAGIFATVEDPFENAHIIAEARPEKFSVRAFAEPVHIKYERRIAQALSDFEPVPKIIADVVTAERQHRHRIAPDLTDRAGRGGGCFRSHGRAEINTVFPIERLKNEGQGCAPA